MENIRRLEKETKNHNQDLKRQDEKFEEKKGTYVNI